MKRFCDSTLMSRRSGHVMLSVLILLSILLQPLSVFAKPLSIGLPVPVAEELVVSAPILTAPEHNAKTTGINYPPTGVPKLEWEPVANAKKYKVEISVSVGFAQPLVVSVETVGTTYTPQEALADREYFWRVSASDGKAYGPLSDVRIFVKNWGANGSLVLNLISPPDGAERIAFTNDDFQWAPFPGAAMYKFDISTDPEGSNVVYSAETLKAHHTPTKRLSTNLYYWRVTPVDSQGHFGVPSEARAFSFNWNIAPQLLAPANDLDMAFVPRFAWTAVEAARKYQLQISSQPDFSLANIYETVNTEYTPEKALSNDQDYYWRVKAIDYENISSPWSEARRFRAKWNFKTQLLTPVHNIIKQSHPFLSWTPIAGAERYQLRIDETTSFERSHMDEIFFNVTTAGVNKIEESTVYLDADYFWQVRGIDAQGNYTPWSDIHTFRYALSDFGPNLIYPLPYYAPDAVNLPVHGDRTIAWPLFVWDGAHLFSWPDKLAETASYYEVTVASDLAFQAINFQIETTGPAAAPTLSHPFTGLQNGQIYYWRVRAYRANGQQLGVDHVWVTRIDQNWPELPAAAAITPIYPRDAFESIISSPLLGWLPVTGAANYRVQLSNDPNFNTIVDEAAPQFVNYAPGQGRRTLLPFGAYWWRVRAESAPGVALGGWSEVRRFNLSVDLLASNNANDIIPPPYPATLLGSTTRTPKYLSTMSHIASSTAIAASSYELGDLHMMINRIHLKNGAYPIGADNLTWVLAFGTSGVLSSDVKYGIYIDADHRQNSGGTTDPLGKTITVDSLYLPDYVFYIQPTNDSEPITPDDVTFYVWANGIWEPGKSLTNIGGDAWYSPDDQGVQLMIPYGALGSNEEDFGGSLAVTVFSTKATDSSGMVDSIPSQTNVINKPALASNIIMPLYPFDTPLSNPIVHYDMPPLRWRLPYHDSVDGYLVQIARDAKFTDLVETWELNERNQEAFYSFLTTTFQSQVANEDNESYYWRVRLRYERFASASQYDYGPWSPAMRFKLESRQVGNPQLSTGELAETTPSFWWDRVEGAAGYTLQVDNDANFSGSILINREIDGTSYTPITPLPDGTYYWRVAMRRSDSVLGRWTPTMSFVKQSLTPTPLTPIQDEIINGQPTFKWTAILTPTDQPRVAAPLYQIQLDDDPNFGSLVKFTTESTAFTLPEGKSIADGTWHWRVALVDADNNVGAYSAPQKFYKEYLAPILVRPGQNDAPTGITSFEWESVPGADHYEIEIDDDDLFNSPLQADTDNTKYTPTKALPADGYYWRVRIVDEDGKTGPFVKGRVQLQQTNLSLGNYVWIDTNNNGTVDSGEPPVPNGVVLELLDGSGASLDQLAQTQNGFYRFTGLNIGEYRVRLAVSNFTGSGLLQGYVHSMGSGQEGDPNSNGDQNDNGQDTSDPALAGIMSAKIALGHDEPIGETPTNSGIPGSDGSNVPDADSNLTLDFGVVPSNGVHSVGNFVGTDVNNDGQIDIDTNQQPVPVPNGVVLELLNGDGSTTGRTTTTISGYYVFSGLAPGDYRVRINASNFFFGGAIENYQHSSGASQELDPNNNGDQNDNGLDGSFPASNGITSGIITLSDSEPLGEMSTITSIAGEDGRGTPDANSNLTVDFALIPGKPTAFNNKVYLPTVRR